MTGAEQSVRHGSHFFNQTVASAEKYGIAHRLLDANEIKKRFPQFKLQGNKKGYFKEKVFDFSVNNENKVIVKTNKGEYEPEKAKTWFDPGTPSTGSPIADSRFSIGTNCSVQSTSVRSSCRIGL